MATNLLVNYITISKVYESPKIVKISPDISVLIFLSYFYILLTKNLSL